MCRLALNYRTLQRGLGAPGQPWPRVPVASFSRKWALEEELERDGVRLKPGAEVMAAGFNPPWTPSFLKTNEVMLEVEP